MKRLKQISEQIRERIDQFIEETEGNESLLEKTIVDMKKRINVAKDLVATAIVELQRLKQAYQDAVDAAERWGKKVDVALNSNDAESATEARQRKQNSLQQANDLEQQIHAQATVVENLKTALLEFYQQYQDASNRVKTLSQRQKQAETRAEFYKLLVEFDLPDNNVFQQAEQELEAAETEAQKWEERNRPTTVVHETKKEDFNLDEALAALKSDILGSDQND